MEARGHFVDRRSMSPYAQPYSSRYFDKREELSLVSKRTDFLLDGINFSAKRSQYGHTTDQLRWGRSRNSNHISPTTNKATPLIENSSYGDQKSNDTSRINPSKVPLSREMMGILKEDELMIRDFFKEIKQKEQVFNQKLSGMLAKEASFQKRYPIAPYQKLFDHHNISTFSQTSVFEPSTALDSRLEAKLQVYIENKSMTRQSYNPDVSHQHQSFDETADSVSKRSIVNRTGINFTRRLTTRRPSSECPKAQSVPPKSRAINSSVIIHPNSTTTRSSKKDQSRRGENNKRNKHHQNRVLPSHLQDTNSSRRENVSENNHSNLNQTPVLVSNSLANTPQKTRNYGPLKTTLNSKNLLVSPGSTRQRKLIGKREKEITRLTAKPHEVQNINTSDTLSNGSTLELRTIEKKTPSKSSPKDTVSTKGYLENGVSTKAVKNNKNNFPTVKTELPDLRKHDVELGSSGHYKQPSSSNGKRSFKSEFEQLTNMTRINDTPEALLSSNKSSLENSRYTTGRYQFHEQHNSNSNGSYEPLADNLGEVKMLEQRCNSQLSEDSINSNPKRVEEQKDTKAQTKDTTHQSNKAFERTRDENLSQEENNSPKGLSKVPSEDIYEDDFADEQEGVTNQEISNSLVVDDPLQPTSNKASNLKESSNALNCNEDYEYDMDFEEENLSEGRNSQEEQSLKPSNDGLHSFSNEKSLKKLKDSFDSIF